MYVVIKVYIKGNIINIVYAIAKFSLKDAPTGIRTRTVYSWGGCNDHCATPQERSVLLLFLYIFVQFNSRNIDLSLFAFAPQDYIRR
jgi:hypothetical protein